MSRDLLVQMAYCISSQVVAQLLIILDKWINVI